MATKKTTPKTSATSPSRKAPSAPPTTKRAPSTTKKKPAAVAPPKPKSSATSAASSAKSKSKSKSNESSPSRTGESDKARKSSPGAKKTAKWNLRLYIAGDSPRSRTALANLQRICEERLEKDYEIEVIDLTKVPHLAKADQILAVPTLIRSLPEPMKRLIGDLSDSDRALVALEMSK